MPKNVCARMVYCNVISDGKRQKMNKQKSEMTFNEGDIGEIVVHPKYEIFLSNY